MPRPPVRFLHAQGLKIDVPVDELAEASPSFRDVLLSAGGRALQSLVDIAIDRDVDFLLLGGDTFCEAERSVSARAQLRAAFERCWEAAIPVFVVPGERDPAAAWLAFPSLPENVTLLTPDPAGDGPHLIERGESDVVSLEFWHQSLKTMRRAAPPQQSAWRIAVLADSPWRETEVSDDSTDSEEHDSLRRIAELGPDVALVAGRSRRQTETVARTIVHSPGVALPDTISQKGPWGASFVTLPVEGFPNFEFVPLSPVGIVAAELTIDRSTSEEEIVEALQRSIRSCEWPSSQQLLIARWTLRGRGPWLRSLQDHDYREMLMESVLEGIARPDRRVLPSFRIIATQERLLPRDRQSPKSLLAQAQSALEESSDVLVDVSSLRRELQDRRWLMNESTQWPEAGALLAGAGRHLADWLTSTAIDREEAL